MGIWDRLKEQSKRKSKNGLKKSRKLKGNCGIDKVGIKEIQRHYDHLKYPLIDQQQKSEVEAALAEYRKSVDK